MAPTSQKTRARYISLAALVAGCATVPLPVAPPQRVIVVDRLEIAPLPATVEVLARAAWDETPPGALRGVTRYREPLAEQLEWIVIHHSAFTEPEGPPGIERYHLEVSGFADVGYHFIIGTDGTVYEGRDIHEMGAHAGVTVEASERARDIKKGAAEGTMEDARRLDPDYGAIGIVVDGFFFNGHRPSVSQHRSVAALVQQLRVQYDIAADHVIAHSEVRARITEARGLTASGKETVCPGPGLVPLVEDIRSADLAAAASPAVELDGQEALLEYCYRDWRHRGGRHLLEPITMRFIANGDGVVLTAQVETSAPVDARFYECTREALYELRVPSPATPATVSMTVRYRDRPGRSES